MAPETRGDAFSDVAVELGLITPVQLGQALDAQRSSGSGATKPLFDVLIELNLLTPEQVATIKQAQDKRSISSERRIGPFEIIEKIGAGGMGAVYRARDTRKGRQIALKILPPVLAKDQRYLERFIREAELASKLDHDNIVKGYGAGESSGLHYFAMEYVDGENVQQMLGRVDVFPEETALRIILPIARALQHSHYHGLLHQDVKPENIIIDRKGIAKLLDLGLARRAGDVATVRLGTPLYASPEQVQGDRPADIRSDLYSLGATLYHMLTGRPPYVGKDDKQTMSMHLEEEMAWPQDYVPELSDNVCHVVAKLLVKNPDYRYQNPKEVIHDIEALLDDRDPVFSRKSQQEMDAQSNESAARGPRRRPGQTGDHRRLADGPRQSRGQGPSRRAQRKKHSRPVDDKTTTLYLIAAIGVVVMLSIVVILLAVAS
jgi:serine/threonine protein kinase